MNRKYFFDRDQDPGSDSGFHFDRYADPVNLKPDPQPRSYQQIILRATHRSFI